MDAIFATDEAQEVARALAAVAAADGAIQQREASFLDEFAMNHSVAGISFIPEPLDVDRLARLIVGADKRREVVRLCLHMALVDGSYADGEVRAIARIAAALDIDDATLARLTEAARAK
jgi:tellurite resistance protein